jgi:hypothetical protein
MLELTTFLIPLIGFESHLNSQTRFGDLSNLLADRTRRLVSWISLVTAEQGGQYPGCKIFVAVSVLIPDQLPVVASRIFVIIYSSFRKLLEKLNRLNHIRQSQSSLWRSFVAYVSFHVLPNILLTNILSSDAI